MIKMSLVVALVCTIVVTTCLVITNVRFVVGQVTVAKHVLGQLYEYRTYSYDGILLRVERSAPFGGTDVVWSKK